MGLFDSTTLVVNQKAKLIELTNEYAICDENGNRIGTVRQVGQGKGRKLLRALTNVDQFLSIKLEIADGDGNVVLRLERGAKLLKSKIAVTDGKGNAIGNINQENVIGKIHFSLEAGGRTVGSINAENWRAWNFNIQDDSGREVARVTKKWAGVLKEAFTTADNYFVEIPAPLEEPLRSLVLAAALCVDTALKQDDK
ncbi:MAG TPA: phospholipid scramblase-related protein [Acidimicrobiales bacterium]|nr:phospholipid scramblase-related protein [Acidimicrobiales bacterium]